MYTNKLVVAIKVGGKVLRENGDTVALPFGSEYSILLKNLDSVRRQVSISVDGQDATEGSRLVLAPNSNLEIERFIRNGNMNAGNRFKFIERTAAVEAHRGVGAEDGLIRVEGWREYVRPYVPPQYPFFIGNLRVGQVNRLSSPSAAVSARSARFRSFDSMEAERSDAGITVPGSESRQQFHNVQGFSLEPGSTVIVLRLRGAVAGEPVSVPVTVERKPECITCGKTCRAGAAFCDRCGTVLAVL